MYQILTCSEKAKKYLDYTFETFERGEVHANAKYPFGMMLVGESFGISVESDIKKEKQRLHSLITATNKRLNKRFKLFYHEQFKTFELCRIK